MISHASPIVARVRFLLSQANNLLQRMPAETRRAIIEECLPEPVQPIPANPETFYRTTPGGVRMRIHPRFTRTKKGTLAYWYATAPTPKCPSGYPFYVGAASRPHGETEAALERIACHVDKLNQAANTLPAEIQPNLL